jgi:predicted RND superfamily exporter protein
MFRSSLLSRVTAASSRHPWRFLLAALALSLGSGWLATGLDLRTSLEELLPSDFRSVAHAKELARRIGGDGNVLVNVEALDGPQDLPRAQALASKLAKEYLALGPDVIRSVESSIAPVSSWYADHWPLFLDLSDLRKARDRLVEGIGKAKARANPLYAGLEDEEPGESAPPVVTEPMLDPDKPSPRQEVLNRFAVYKGGFITHPDGRSVTLVVRPTGSSLGADEARALLARMRSMAESHRAELDAGHLRVGFAGSFASFLAEYEAILHDVFSTFFLVMSLVLLSMLVFFRQVRPVLALGTVVLMAAAVTFGITRLVIGYLNAETAFLGSIVVGNGINYGIIYLARLGQLRHRGMPLEAACQESSRAAMTGTFIASAGTAISFGTLVIAANRGFRHFGVIGGVGMLLCWAATFALLPAVMAVFERIWPVRPRVQPARELPARSLLKLVFSRPRPIVAAFVLGGAACLSFFLWKLPTVMERNLDNLSNEVTGNDELKRDQYRAYDAIGAGKKPGEGSMAGVVALLPSPQAARRYCEVVRERQGKPRIGALVQGCETVSTVVPSDQKEKLAIIADIRSRLTDSLLRRLPERQAERAREIRAQLAAQRPLGVEDAPPTLLDRWRERDGTIGRIAFVRARSDAKLELGPNLRDFVGAVRDVPIDGRTYDAAGESVVVSDLLEDIGREGPRATALSFLGVCALLVLFFRNVRSSVYILASLTLGVILMGGVATALGIKINFFNFVVYPITFGIAVDYGANVLSRMNDRRSALPALAEVGPAVAFCSLTTIIGYGSLILSINRALRSFGWYAMLGEFTTLVTALVLLPALVLVFPPPQPQAVTAVAPDDSIPQRKTMNAK